MATILKNVIVIGGGGNVGPYIVDALLRQKFQVSILSRLSSTTTFPANITVYKTDYSFESLVDAFKGQDIVVSAISTFQTSRQQLIIDAAVAAGIKRFIPSEYGIDTSLPQVVEYVPPTLAKTETVAYLKTKEQFGMSWTAICVGGFFDQIVEAGLMGWDVKNCKVTIFGSGNQPYEATNVKRVGEAVASTLVHLPETENRYIYINSFTTTQNKVLAALEKASGKPYTVEYQSVEELAASGHEKLKDGSDFMGALEVITAGIYGNGGLNDFGDKKILYNNLFGFETEDLDKVIEQVVAKINGGI